MAERENKSKVQPLRDFTQHWNLWELPRLPQARSAEANLLSSHRFDCLSRVQSSLRQQQQRLYFNQEKQKTGEKTEMQAWWQRRVQ